MDEFEAKEYNKHDLDNTDGVAFEEQPYFRWLEGVMRELSVMEVKAISIEVVESDGSASTRYWNTTTSDRAMMMAAMEEAQVIDLIADNREMIVALLNGEEEDDDDDSLCDDMP